MDVDYDCFPAIALQQMAIQDEVQPDLVFFIEDLFARDVLEGILDYYFRNIYQSRKPIYKLLPVGGWGETIRFTVASIDYLIPNQTNVYAMLDADVLPEIQAIQENPNRTTKEQEKLNLYNNNQGRIRFLPITPELGIVNLLMSNPHNHFQSVQDHFNGVFDIQQIILEESSRPGITYNTNPRTAAKTRLDYYISRIMNATNRDYSYVRFKLGQYYASQYCPSNHPALQQLLNPLMN